VVFEVSHLQLVPRLEDLEIFLVTIKEYICNNTKRGSDIREFGDGKV
jgi:hypothetical protein